MPELCHAHRFPASLWRQSVWIPSIFYRLNSLLLADELRIEIQASTKLGAPVLSGIAITLLVVNSQYSDKYITECFYVDAEQWEPLWMNDINSTSHQKTTGTLMENGKEGGVMPSALICLDTKPNNNGNYLSLQDMYFIIILQLTFVTTIVYNFISFRMEGEQPVIDDIRNSIWNVDLYSAEINENFTRRFLVEKPTLLGPSQLDDKAFGFCFDDETLAAKNPIGPSPGQILHALTTSVTNAGFDLERLEVIGDSFLKLATSIRVYCEAPSHFHEGKMTHLRILQVSNDNLFKLGKKKLLPNSMTATKFIPKENWLPPCYFPSDPSENVLLIKFLCFTINWNII